MNINNPNNPNNPCSKCGTHIWRRNVIRKDGSIKSYVNIPLEDIQKLSDIDLHELLAEAELGKFYCQQCRLECSSRLDSCAMRVEKQTNENFPATIVPISAGSSRERIVNKPQIFDLRVLEDNRVIQAIRWELQRRKNVRSIQNQPAALNRPILIPQSAAQSRPVFIPQSAAQNRPVFIPQSRPIPIPQSVAQNRPLSIPQRINYIPTMTPPGSPRGTPSPIFLQTVASTPGAVPRPYFIPSSSPPFQNVYYPPIKSVTPLPQSMAQIVQPVLKTPAIINREQFVSLIPEISPTQAEFASIIQEK